MDSESIATKADVATGISLIDIEKSFGKTRVLNKLSLDIFQGELCCLLGPSGCGKTTALKIIDGLLELDSGQIFLDQTDITNTPTQKRNLGMVFQNYALFPQLDVYENVAYGLRRRNIPKSQLKPRAVKALETVQLSGYERRQVHELSGGQQQRVALARALVIEPRALLLDEPLSSLDARLRTDMRQEIKRIQRELGITTIYVTHDQEEAMSISDRIAVINQGTVEQIGTPKEIYENPSSQFVADFIGRINFIPVECNESTFSLFGRKYDLPNDMCGCKDYDMVCAVRPERIRILKSADNLPKVVVKDSFFIGAAVRYKLTPAGHTNLEIEAETYIPDELLENGQEVSIDIDKNDLKLFRA
ncbi:MAG: ABC transporter ATP-binding protein [Dehalococcoidales bacterium]|nr:ABC transporter ATP-binding protein [Dehalococcoidales bacterium]